MLWWYNCMAINMEKAIIEYLKKQSDEFALVVGRKKLMKDEIIVKMKKDRKFKKFILNQLAVLSLDLLSR